MPFVYERQIQEATFADIPRPIYQRPIIHTSGSRHGATTFQSPLDQISVFGSMGGKGQESLATNTPEAEPRRFHMSRADIMSAGLNYPTHRNSRGVSKKRSAPAVFVVRRHKRVPSTKSQSIAHRSSRHAPEGIPNEPPVPQHSEEMDVDADEVAQRKRPGLASQTKKEGAAKKVELPDSMVNRWNVDLDQLTADMNAFAMQQIGLNLQRQEEDDKKQKERAAVQRARLVSQSSPSRFKPKAPAKRYAERHPEGSPKPADQKISAKPNAGTSDTDEEDYIIETYVRVPASAMNKQQVAAKDVGLLVFDEEPDMELFYGANDDSDDDWAEDDEDENAENYYTADYLDDKVASNDEFGQNAYNYRNENASDPEEYDVNAYQDSNPDDSDAKNGFKLFTSQDGQLGKHL